MEDRSGPADLDSCYGGSGPDAERSPLSSSTGLKAAGESPARSIVSSEKKRSSKKKTPKNINSIRLAQAIHKATVVHGGTTELYGQIEQKQEEISNSRTPESLASRRTTPEGSQRPAISPETIQTPTVLVPEFSVEKLSRNLNSQSTSKQYMTGPVDSKELSWCQDETRRHQKVPRLALEEIEPAHEGSFEVDGKENIPTPRSGRTVLALSVNGREGATSITGSPKRRRASPEKTPASGAVTPQLQASEAADEPSSAQLYPTGHKPGVFSESESGSPHAKSTSDSEKVGGPSFADRIEEVAPGRNGLLGEESIIGSGLDSQGRVSEVSSVGSGFNMQNPADSSSEDASEAESESSGTGEITEREISSSSEEDMPGISGNASGSSRNWRINHLSPQGSSSVEESQPGIIDTDLPQASLQDEVQDLPATPTVDSVSSDSGGAIPALRLEEPTVVKEDIRVQKQAVPSAAVQSHSRPKQKERWAAFAWSALQWLLMGVLLLAVLTAGFRMPNALSSHEYWSSKAGVPHRQGQLWNMLSNQKLPGLEALKAKLPHPLADKHVNKPLKEGMARVPGIKEPSFIANSKKELESTLDLGQPAKGASKEILRADVKQAHHPADAIVKIAEVHDPTALQHSPPPLSASSPSLTAGLKKMVGVPAAPLASFFKTGRPAETAAVAGERAAEAVYAPTSIYPAKVNSSFWGKLPGWTQLAATILGGCAVFTFLVWSSSALLPATAASELEGTPEPSIKPQNRDASGRLAEIANPASPLRQLDSHTPERTPAPQEEGSSDEADSDASGMSRSQTVSRSIGRVTRSATRMTRSATRSLRAASQSVQETSVRVASAATRSINKGRTTVQTDHAEVVSSPSMTVTTRSRVTRNLPAIPEARRP